MRTESILPILRSSLILLGVAAMAAGCKKPPAELAPAAVGDWWDYKFTVGGGNSESNYQAKFVLEPGENEDSFLLDSVPNGNEEPVQVDKALDAGKPIKQHFLGQLWLPPAARQVNATTRAGQVKEQRQKWNYWSVWVVEGFGAAKGQYFFDANTGYLVGANIPTSGGAHTFVLTKSSVVGLTQ